MTNEQDSFIEYKDTIERLEKELRFMQTAEQDARLQANAFREVLEQITEQDTLSGDYILDKWEMIRLSADALSRYKVLRDGGEGLYFVALNGEDSSHTVGTINEGLALVEEWQHQILSEGSYVEGETVLGLYSYNVDNETSTLERQWVLRGMTDELVHEDGATEEVNSVGWVEENL